MANTTFTTPEEDRYFEDYVLHSVHQFGHSLTPGLSKSGWDRDSVLRMLAEYYLPATGELTRYDIEDAEWKTVVLPGQELIVRATVIETERLSSKPGYGKVTSLIEVLTKNSEVVVTMKMWFTFPCAPF